MKHKQKTNYGFVISLVIVLILVVITLKSTGLANAQTYTALEPLPCISGNGINCPVEGAPQDKIEFSTYLQYMFNLFIAIAAASSVFMITFGGFQYMTTDSWQGKSEGLAKVRNAIYGLLMVLASYLILRTIDPRLVAIPTTLVKPLNITIKGSNLDEFDSFMDKLMRDAADHKANMTIVQANRQSAQNKIDRAKTEIESINDQIRGIVSSQISSEDETDVADPSLISDSEIESRCRPPVEQELTALCAAKAQKMNEISAATNEFVLNTSIGIINSISTKCGTTATDLTCFEYLQRQVQDEFNKSSAKLPADQKQVLQAYAAFYQGIIYMNRSIVDLTDKGMQISGPTGQFAKDILNAMKIINDSVNYYSSSPYANQEILSLMKGEQQKAQGYISAWHLKQ